MTGDLRRRLALHRQLRKGTFTGRYRVTRLVYYEAYSYVHDAIAREKQLKAGSRARKRALVDDVNPRWRDLTNDLMLL